MKVRELIEVLENYSDDMDVHFAYNFGDYWKTTVAATIGFAAEGYVRDSNYHSMPKVLSADDVTDDDTEVLLLSSNPMVE